MKASANELQEERAGEVIFEDENVTPLDEEENNSVIIADSDDEDDIEHFNGNMNITLTDSTDPSIEAQTVNLGWFSREETKEQIASFRFRWWRNLW